MAILTFGEGYHNYHHEFQHDYRNGVKPWQFDSTKWIIWTLNKLGLASNLRRVAPETIFQAELRETQRALEVKVSAAAVEDVDHSLILSIQQRLHDLSASWEEYQTRKMEMSRESWANLREELRALISQIRSLDLQPAIA